eukprot:6332017-Alexandrium_andersonii.AAC.1
MDSSPQAPQDPPPATGSPKRSGSRCGSSCGCRCGSSCKLSHARAARPRNAARKLMAQLAPPGVPARSLS